MHRALRPGSFTFLLICLVALIFGVSFAQPDRNQLDVNDLILPVLLLSGLYGLSRRRASLIIGLVLSLLAFVGRALYIAGPAGWSDRTLAILDHASALPIFAFLLAFILTRVLRSERIRWDTISGAICVYLLIGMLWALVYALVLTVNPDAITFAFAPSTETSRRGGMVYFSFVTLTTLGYGDVIPHSPLARSLATLEAVIGPLYLTILVARLVGLHLAHQTPPPAHRS